ncbi:MAG: hypothetical protein IJP11_01820 [Oscillospiraceae bacterium]|nr:hypothetical protein [Oscillospiraceae bacterium]
MYCIKCGREVADGELFCSACSNRPDEKKPEPEVRQPERIPEAQSSRTMQAAKKPAKSKKKINILLIPLILLCILTVAASVGMIRFYEEMTVIKNNYRVKEANLESQINELETLQLQLSEKTLALETAEADLAACRQTVTELEQEITLLESSASQGAYDATSAQQTITRLEGEKETLNTTIGDLEDEIEELSTSITDLEDEIESLGESLSLATKELEAAEEDLEAAEEDLEAKQKELDEAEEALMEAEKKADFMDTYVVFVNNDESNLYHKYDCSKFVKADFWAYSRKLAENYGYTACPTCGG